MLCTDGLALPLAGGGGEVGATLARELARPPDIVDFARLLDFSRSTYDDDRSLIAVWGRGVSIMTDVTAVRAPRTRSRSSASSTRFRDSGARVASTGRRSSPRASTTGRWS